MILLVIKYFIVNGKNIFNNILVIILPINKLLVLKNVWINIFLIVLFNSILLIIRFISFGRIILEIKKWKYLKMIKKKKKKVKGSMDLWNDFNINIMLFLLIIEYIANKII
jgi:hypothetical protein